MSLQTKSQNDTSGLSYADLKQLSSWRCQRSFAADTTAYIIKADAKEAFRRKVATVCSPVHYRLSPHAEGVLKVLESMPGNWRMNADMLFLRDMIVEFQIVQRGSSLNGEMNPWFRPRESTGLARPATVGSEAVVTTKPFVHAPCQQREMKAAAAMDQMPPQ